MTGLDRSGDVQEVEATAEVVAGQTVSALTSDLPDDCYVALISRGSSNHIPHSDDTVERGTLLTIIGHTDAVREAIDYCT